MYAPEQKLTVYCKECWYGDGWDALEYGKDYDWNRPFFVQFRELLETVPRIGVVVIGTNINCDYANYIKDSKNAYLAFSVTASENVYYSRSVDKSKEIFDSYNVKQGEQCYENLNSIRNYGILFSVRTRDCLNSSFLFDCVNCQNCFMSSNLRNKQFIIRNKQYTKETYEAEMQGIDLGSHKIIEQLKQEFWGLMRNSLHMFVNVTKIVHSIGDNLENTKAAQYCFSAYNLENVRFSARIFSSKDCWDIYGTLAAEMSYEGVSALNYTQNGAFVISTTESHDVRYADWCIGSAYLFGCSGIRKKEYCILNKQYTKDEYERMVPKIRERMNAVPYKDSRGNEYRYGEFFPANLSLFAYNETIASEFFPLEKSDVLSQGYQWRDSDAYPHKPTRNTTDLPDNITEIGEEILNEVIRCSNCEHVYRILQPEFQFLKQRHISLPQKCQDCRYKDRFALRNPLKLWHRKCRCAGKTSEDNIRTNSILHFHGENHCPNEFETSYAPERPEIVYCEQCYQSEVV
jgi:hypothetical protein